jgi:Domain of Unknown Function (DUF1206)
MSASAQAHRIARSSWVGWLGRIGFAAQGTSFVIIAVLALELAFGGRGRLIDPRGAFAVLAEQSWTRALLVLLAIGFAAYALWRLAQALFDRGGMGSAPSGVGRRLIQLGQAVLYGLLAASATRVLFGFHGQGSPKHAAAGMLGWPAGPELVGTVGACMAVIAGVNVYWGLSGRFTESLQVYKLRGKTERLLVLTGRIGFVALGAVLALVAWFLVKAAVEFNARKVVSLGGAMAHLARADYGSWLLTAAAAGLFAYGTFGLLQARYHRV